jgi:hypothetical protein
MGRSSVDATKACLILAVRADRAALPARVAGLFPFALDLTGLFAVFGFDFAEAAGFPDEGEELAELCAETGSRAISVESTTARQRVTSGAGVGEVAALMFPL